MCFTKITVYWFEMNLIRNVVQMVSLIIRGVLFINMK